MEQIILPKNIFLAQLKIVQNFHYFCKVRACPISVKNSIFQKMPKIVEKHFFWWVEQIILPKNIFLPQFRIVQNFHYFCKVRACRISVKNSIFQKIASNCGETLLLMSGTNNFAKKYFLSTIKIVQNFHNFCKVRACPISVKNSIFQKMPKIVEKHFFWWVEQIILPKKYFLTTIKDSTKFSLFL